MNTLRLFTLSAVLWLILPSASPAEDHTELVLKEQLTKLETRLKLTETQKVKIRNILVFERRRRNEDRRMFKHEALKLIDVGHDRRETTHMAIQDLLSPEQNKIFRELTGMNRFDRDLFETTEGLRLDDDQEFAVEGILIDFYNTVRDVLPEETAPGRTEPVKIPGEPGINRGDRDPGIMTSPFALRRFAYQRTIVKEAASKRDKAIKKLLNKEQKKLFKQIKKHRYQQLLEQRRKQSKR